MTFLLQLVNLSEEGRDVNDDAIADDRDALGVDQP